MKKLFDWKVVSFALVISALIFRSLPFNDYPVLNILVSIYLFIIAVIFFLYLPGRFINNFIKAKLSFLQDIFLSIVYGMLLFTLVSFVFSYFKADFITIIIVAIIDFFVLKRKNLFSFKLNRSDLLIYTAILLLAIIFSVPMLTSGYVGDSLRLVGVNNYDGYWYLSLINELKVNFPPQHPGFSGEQLYGYHFLLFFLMAKIGSYFNLSNINLMFKLFPLLIALLWGVGVYVLMLDWSKSRAASLFAVFLTMFGGSFVFISWFEGHRNLSLDSGYGILQPSSSLVNPTFAISIVILTAFLFSIFKYMSTKSSRWLLPITVLVGLAPLFKVYGGIIILGGFLLFVGYEFFRKRFKILLSLLGVVILFFTTYWPFTDRSVYLILYPFWAPHNVLRDNFPWYGYDEKIRTYSEQGVIKGIIRTELYAFYIFFIGNIGSRIIGLFLGAIKAIRERKLPSIFFLLVFSMTLASIIIPLFFIQSGKVFETIQFAWYFLFLVSLFSAFGIGYLFSAKLNIILKLAIVSVVVLLTLPSAIEGISKYVVGTGWLVDQSFYESTKFLEKRGNYYDTVLSIPEKTYEINYDTLYRMFRAGGPRIPALANKRSFLSFEYFDFKELDVKGRIMFTNALLVLERDLDEKRSIGTASQKDKIDLGFKKYEIKYIHSPYPLKFVSLFDNIKQVYGNSGAYVYEIK